MGNDSNIFGTTTHLTDEQLLRYLHGSLNHEERHAIERHLVDCGLCSEALEGMKKMKSETRILTITDDLRRLVRRRKTARRKIFSQVDLITLSLLIFLIVFLIIVATVMIWKR